AHATGSPFPDSGRSRVRVSEEPRTNVSTPGGSSTMKLFSKAVIVAAVVALLLAPTAAFAQTKSAPGDPIGCPKGWVPVAPPVNPILRCLPGEIAAAVPTTPLATLDTRLLCPE